MFTFLMYLHIPSSVKRRLDIHLSKPTRCKRGEREQKREGDQERKKTKRKMQSRIFVFGIIVIILQLTIEQIARKRFV